MKVLEKTRRVVTNNIEATTFTVKQSAKTFQILSSGLYSDKISAIIRELSTNAQDSHIVAKNDRPFDVFLPVNNDPRFYIRDYGTGISPDNVISIYSTYFESNKTQDNNVTGCLGLGSKSPFSYVDNFVVTSYYNGMRYTYTVFINGSGIPSIALVNECETTEETGLKVEFLVQSSDIKNFYNKAEDIYLWFKTKPNFVGHKIEIDEITIDENKPRGDDWYFFRDITYASVVMGNVKYPIKLKDSSLTDEQQLLLGLSLVLELKIGDVDIEASREGLSYDVATVSFLKRKLSSIVTEIRNKFENDVKSSKCLWHAACELYDVDYNIKKLIANSPLYNGQKVPNQFDVVNIGNVWLSSMYLYRGKVRTRDIPCITPYKNTKFYLSDLKTGSVSRLKKLVADNGTNSEYILIRYHDKRTEAENNLDLKEFLDTIGLNKEELIFTSTLPETTRSKPVARNKGLSNSVLLFDYHSYNVDSWQNVTQLPKQAVYVPISNFKPTNLDKELHYDTNHVLKKVIDAYQVITGTKIAVYGIKKSQVKNVINVYPDWVYLMDIINDDKHYSDFSKKYYLGEQVSLRVDSVRNLMKFCNRWYNEIPNNMKELYNDVHKLDKQYPKIDMSYVKSYKTLKRIGYYDLIPKYDNYDADILDINNKFDAFSSWMKKKPLLETALYYAGHVGINSQSDVELELIKNYL